MGEVMIRSMLAAAAVVVLAFSPAIAGHMGGGAGHGRGNQEPSPTAPILQFLDGNQIAVGTFLGFVTNGAVW